MKYGQLSHGNVDIGSTKASLIASGGDDDRPPGEDGQIRYNKDTRVEGLGDYDGFGRFELFTNGEWVPLLTEADMESTDDIAAKEDLNDNIMFKFIAESLRDTFTTAIGTLELVQTGTHCHWFCDAAGDPAKEPGNVRTDVNSLPEYLSDFQVRAQQTATPQYFNATAGSGNQKIFTKTTGGGSLDAAFRAVLGNGKIYKVHLNNHGSGYNPENPPAAVIDTGGGSGAILRATIVSGIITNVTVVSGGSGYRPGKTKIYLKGGGYRNIGELEPVISDGVIISVTIKAQGDGYARAPQIFVGDGGFGGSLKVNVNPNGTLHSIDVLNPGFDYLNAPSVVITPPDSGTVGTSTAIVGSGKVIDIILQKPVTTTSIDNGTIPLTVTGNGTGATAELVIENGVGTGVRVINRGGGYTYANATAPVGSLKTITGIDFQQHHFANVFFDFKFDIFKSCGVPASEKSKYDIALMSNLYRIHPFGAPAAYAGQTIAMGVKFTPLWSPFNNNTHPNYGLYKAEMSLFGQRQYYTSAVGASWMANLIKSRF